MIHFLISKFLFFPSRKSNIVFYLVKEYNIETESTIRSILHSSRLIMLQIFCTLAITSIIWDKVFKNRPSKIFQRLSSTNFTWSILEFFVLFIDEKTIVAGRWIYLFLLKWSLLFFGHDSFYVIINKNEPFA